MRVAWMAILLLAWVAAAAFNAGGFIMGGAPSVAGMAATTIAVVVWPVAGWFTAPNRSAFFIRIAITFWIIVAAGTPLVFWILSEGPGLSASRGGGALLIIGFGLAAPLYGLAGALPGFGLFAYSALLWTVIIAVAAFALTMGAFFYSAHLIGRLGLQGADEAREGEARTR